MSDSLLQKVKDAAGFLKQQYAKAPEVAIILGSGLGNFSANIIVEKEVPYTSIPHFPVSTVQGHQGKMIFGTIAGKQVVAMSGRFHYYEGYSPQEIVFPIRVLKQLGVQTLLLSNAAGGVNPTFKVGDIMIIHDHISFNTPNPLIGKNIDEWGTRFPDMSEPYKKHLIAQAKSIAATHKIDVKEGVYFVVTGPTFETRAEYKMIHILGADAVGMSTVQECIVANHMGMNVFAASVITDIGIREEENTITHQEVLEAAKEAEPKLAKIFVELVSAV